MERNKETIRACSNKYYCVTLCTKYACNSSTGFPNLPDREVIVNILELPKLTFLPAFQTLLLCILLLCLPFPSLSIYFMHSERVFIGPCVQAAASTVSVTEEELSDKCAAETQVLLNAVPLSGVNGTPRSTFEQKPLFAVIQV